MDIGILGTGNMGSGLAEPCVPTAYALGMGTDQAIKLIRR